VKYKGGVMDDVEGFRIDTPEKAAWAMRKYRVLGQRKAQNTALATAERNRIDAWETRLNATVSDRMDYYQSHLEIYAIKERLAGNKTVDLPDGTIKTRNTGISFEIDKSVFLEWALEEKRDDLTRVTYAPDMRAIKNAVLIDSGMVIDPVSGEVIPGLTPVPDKVSVSIDIDYDAIDLEGIEGEEDVF
jgi:hypothetical protein